MKNTEKFVEDLNQAVRALSRRDEKMKAIIRRYGACQLRPHTRYFQTLVTAIVSQQLSTKAADTILGRFVAIYSPGRFPKPAQILETPSEKIRTAGISAQKISYIKDLAARTEEGTLKLSQLYRLSDDEVIRMLTAVKGIGVWSAHMFMIFSLGRLDILPVGDLGIRRAIQLSYGFDQLPVAEEIESVAEERGWRPYCSVASWYLWRSLENK